MKKRFVLGVILTLVLAAVLAGCGGGAPKESSAQVSVKDVYISGEGAKYFKVVDGTYELTCPDKNKSAYFIAVKLESLGTFDDAAFRAEKGDVAEKNRYLLSTLDLILLDKDEVSLTTNQFTRPSIGIGDWSTVGELLTSPKGRTIGVVFSGTDNKPGDLIKKAVSFELAGADISYTKVKAETPAEVIAAAGEDLEEAAEDLDAAGALAGAAAVLQGAKGAAAGALSGALGSLSSAASGAASGASGGSTAWKKAMDDYEKLADEVLVFMQKYKANPLDLSLITQSASMLQKAQAAADSMEKMEGDIPVGDMPEFT
jgi:hypothetical protein